MATVFYDITFYEHKNDARISAVLQWKQNFGDLKNAYWIKELKGQQTEEVQIQLVLLSTTMCMASPGSCCESRYKNSYIEFFYKKTAKSYLLFLGS